MTTVCYRDGIIASDGQVTSGDRIDNLNLKKVRKINNCLVAGAGRLSSVFSFFEWFERWSDAQVVQGQAPHVDVFIPEGIDDEDFQGLVIFSDKTIFHYEGGKKSYSMPKEQYVSIGSGCDYALAAMDAGASAVEAVTIAIQRDVFSGGEIFTEELDEEEEELTYEDAKQLTQAELLALIFPEQCTEESGEESQGDVVFDESDIVYEGNYVFLTSDGIVHFGNKDSSGDVYEIALEESSPDGELFAKLISEINPYTLNLCYTELTGKDADEEGDVTLTSVADKIFEILDEKYQKFLTEG